MTYEQWVGIEATARCSRLQGHGISLYWPTVEERQWLAEYQRMKAERGWRRLVRQYVMASFYVTLELTRQLETGVRAVESQQLRKDLGRE